MEEQKNMAFGLIFDNLLGYNLAKLRRLMNLYALLYDALLVSDSWLLTNAALQQLLQQPDGAELLRSEIIVPVLRDNVQNYTEFLAQAAQKKMHSLCATRKFTDFLDKEIEHPQFFSIKDISQAYAKMSERVLERDVLLRLGVSNVAAVLVEKMNKSEKVKTNTFVKDVICPKLSPKDATLVMEIARAPYSLNLPQLLGTGIVGPENFRGDQILSVLQSDSAIGSLIVSETGQKSEYNGFIEESLANWLLSHPVLSSLTAEELAIARDVPGRADYQERLRIFLIAPTSKSWSSLFGSLERYLSQAGSEVFRIRLQRKTLSTEPKEGEIMIEGDTTIKISPPGNPVELRGLTATGAKVQVIGREISLPIVTGKM